MRLILFILPLTLASCFVSKHGSDRVPKRLDAVAYTAWADSENYPFRDTQTVGGVQYVLEYRPKEVEIASLLAKGRADVTQAAEWLAEKSSGMQLRLTILTTGNDLYHYDLKSSESATDRASYYAFSFKEDLRLVTETDSLKPVGYLHEKGLSGYPVARFQLDFAGTPGEAASFAFYDRYFGEGWVQFSLNDWNTDRLPVLELTSPNDQHNSRDESRGIR